MNGEVDFEGQSATSMRFPAVPETIPVCDAEIRTVALTKLPSLETERRVADESERMETRGEPAIVVMV